MFRLHKAAIFVVVFLLLASLFPSVQPANSAFTEKFNYQGKLYSITGGTVPDGNYDLVFKLYADPATTTSVWSSTSSTASLFTDNDTVVELDSATCGGAGYDLITYTSNINEATLQASQTLWNTARKESAIVKSNNTGSNQLCIYHPFSNWSNGEQVTNRIYVKSGLFSTMLGDFNSLSGVDFNQPLYLGVTVGTDAEMKPRRSIGTVPSALNTKTLNGLTWDNPGVIGSATQSSAFFSQLAIGTTTFSGAMLNIKGTGSNALLNIMSSTSASVLYVSSNGFIGIGTTSPQYTLDVTGTSRFNGIINSGNSLAFTGSNAYNLITSIGGFDNHLNLSGGLSTGGLDSLTPAVRLTKEGNLINIGSIQAGEMNLTSAGTFADAVPYTTGESPYSVAIGDLNGDGKADLASANSGTSSLSIFLNNGNGTFATSAPYTTGASPMFVAIGDLNGDGKADLVSADTGSNRLSVFINNGDGTFATAVPYTTGMSPYSIAIGDLNGDGKADLASADMNSDRLSVFINNGDGTFADAVPYTTGTSPYSVAIGDLNGDGKADLASADMYSDRLSVFINNGDGTFATAVPYTTGTYPQSVAIGDLNSDGKADLVSADIFSASLSVIMNNGDGTFATAVPYTTGTFPYSVAIGDLNGDGKADLVSADWIADQLSVFINNGDGTFADAVPYTTGSRPNTVAIGDLNGDGKADLVSADQDSNRLSVFLNEPFQMFYAKAGTGRVGIGTSAPSQLFTVGNNNQFTVSSAGFATSTGLYNAGTLTVTGNTSLANSTTSNLYVSGTLTLASDLSVANGGTGVSTLTGVAIGNGTNAFVGSTSVSDSYINDALTVTGGTLGSNSISSGAAWTTLGSMTIGDGEDDIIINSADWGVSDTGVATFTSINFDTIAVAGTSSFAGLLYANQASGNVGIGISNPEGQLQLADIYTAGGKNLMIGDDVYFSDIDTANTVGIYGNQSSTTASIKLGSGGGMISGKDGNIGIGTTTPEAQLTIQGASVNALLSIRTANGQSALTINSVGMLSSNLVTNIASTSIYVKYSSSDFSQSGATVTVGMATGSDMLELSLASTTNIGNGVTSGGPTLTANTAIGAHSLQRPDGKFLIIHGNNSTTTTIYDPVANTTSVGPNLPARANDGANSLQRPDGKFLIIHGNNSTTTTIYDPVTNTTSVGPGLSSKAYNGSHSLQRLDGTFLIVHGNSSSTSTIYDPAVDTTVAGPTLSATADAGAHSIQRPDGKFLIIHGNSASTTTIYDPVTNTAVAGPTLSANVNIGAHSIQRPDGKFLIIHGNNADTTTTYDPVANTTVAGPTLSIGVFKGGHSIQRPDGKFLIVCASFGNNTNLYDPVTNTTTVGPALSASAEAGAHALQRPDGKFLVVLGTGNRNTTLYDPGYVTTGSYETEDIYSPNLNSSTLLNWQDNGEGNIRFEVKTATTQGGLSSATYATTTNGGLVRPVAGATWVKIRVTMSRVIPSNTATLNPYAETKTWLGISDTKYQRKFAMPKVYSLSLDNSFELKRFGADFGLTTSTSTSSSTPILSNLLGGENGLSMPNSLALGVSGTSSLGYMTSGPTLSAAASYGAHSLQRPDGKLLIVHGNNSASTTIYDPITNYAIAGPTLTAWAGNGAHSLQRPDGKFLIVHSNTSSTTTLYDPVVNTTSIGPTLSANAYAGAHSIQRPDGKFLIVHGYNTTTTTLYDPVTNTTSAGPVLADTVNTGAHSIQRPDGKFLIVHGDSDKITTIYDPITNSAIAGPILTNNANDGAHSLQRPDGKFLIVHGGNSTGTTLYDPNTNTTSAGPTLSVVVSYGAHSLQRSDGKYLILHGDNSTITTIYDPVANSTTSGPTLSATAYYGAHSVQRPDGKFLIVHGNTSTITSIYDPKWITSGYYQSEFMNDATLDSNSVLTWTGNADAFKNGIVNFSVRTATSSATLQGAAWRQIQRAGDLINPGAGETWIQIRINMNRPIPAQPGAGKNVWLGESGVTYNRLPLNPSAGYSNQAGVFVNPVISSFKVMNAGGSDLANFSLNGVSMFRFSASGDAYTRGSGAWNSGGADVAEYFPTDEYGLEPGDLVSITQAGEGLISKTSTAMDENVLGVITTKPGVKLGNDISEGLAGKQAVALVGRVPVKVSQENGMIIKGDKLTSSSQPGVAMKATEAGRVIGVALENYDPLQQTDGKILMFINPHWYPGAVFMEKVDGQMSRWAWVVKKALAELSIDKTLEQVAVLSTGFTDMQFNIFDIYAQLASLRSEIDSIKNQLVQQPSEQIIDPTPVETATTASSSESMATSTASSSVEIIDLATEESQALLVMQENTDSQTPNVEVMNVSSDGIVKVVGSLSIDGRSLTCAGACPPALSEAVDETRGDVGAEGKMVATTFENYCEDGFVWVVGSAKYGTMPGFCVMTDLAKNNGSALPVTVEGAHWKNINQDDARLACRALGAGYHLLNENEWLTLAENIVLNSDNDTDTGQPGLQMNTSSTSLALANGNLLYNLTGTITEWTDQTVTKAGLPILGGALSITEWQEYGDVVNYQGLNLAPYHYLSSANGVGRILIGDGADNTRGFIRGFNGIYGLDLSNAPTAVKPDVGFRCAK